MNKGNEDTCEIVFSFELFILKRKNKCLTNGLFLTHGARCAVISSTVLYIGK